MLGLACEFVGQAIDETLDREVLEFRRHSPCVQSRDVEQGIQQVGHCRERVRLAVDHLQRLLVLDGPAQGPVEKTQRLHRLAQIVAGSCKKRAVGLVRAFGFLSRGNDLILHPLAAGHIANHARHELAAGRLHRAEADFDRKFRVVLASRDKVESGTHRAQTGVFSEGGAILDVLLAKPLRQKHLDGLAEHLFPGIAEHGLCLAVDDRDLAVVVNDDHRVGRRLQNGPEIGLRVVDTGDFANRARDDEAVVRLDRVERDFNRYLAAILAHAVEVEPRDHGPSPRGVVVVRT